MQGPNKTARPELWAGLECSVVRVGDSWRNQAIETGHADRPEDLDLLPGSTRKASPQRPQRSSAAQP
jgi:hypothetical protein